MRNLKALSLTLFFFVAVAPAHAFFAKAYPTIPEAEVTPGHLCENPSEKRYEEHIPYCRRDVSSSRKWDIIDLYDEQYGYQIREIGRDNFKIDHLIPLCMGGSNEDANLWPQHRSVYEQSDPWEQSLCVDLANGSITQHEAIETLLRIKLSIR